ncbi:ABC transporter permease subunit [Nesterenkonia xinjiangensis]|uniref:ABC-2 type transport system permease protein n=1 Tax=Nesterenkonia xinjiangensis TaxID=225327 RepID=A0A7Z0GL26_9MICC|nr:ABC transporter permease subunit [Nesterenkonia xinjiangensis]NYJ77981.1 ABC-2 type transport system permease protein [Nesterenkonia xinjiangensis]
MTPETGSSSVGHPQGAPGLRLNTCTATEPQRRFEVDPALSGLSFLRVLRSELQKLVWLRATWWLGASALVLVLLFAWMSGASLNSMISWQQEDPGAGLPEAALRDMALETPLTGLYFAVILLGCIGVIAITSEHASGSVRSSLSAVPRRVVLYTAKVLATAVVLGVLAALMIVGILAVALPFAATHGLTPDFTATETWHRLITHWAGVVLAGLVGFGLGAILRSTAGGIVTLAILLFVLPMAMEILVSVTEESELVMTLYRWQFANLMSSFTVPGPAPRDGIGSFAAGVGMGAWTAVMTVTGGLLFRRRDA